MSETPSYGALIELISRLEGQDKKIAETALYCLNRLEKKEAKLFNEVQRLKEALRPFADDAVDFWSDDLETPNGSLVGVDVADLRAAAAALGETDG